MKFLFITKKLNEMKYKLKVVYNFMTKDIKIVFYLVIHSWNEYFKIMTK